MGKFLVAVSSKGGVGKSTLSYQVLTALLFHKHSKKHKLIEIDDNNQTDSFVSSIFEPTSFKVERGINEALKELFNVFDDENVVLDVGGGNDSLKTIDALNSMGVDENIVYFIPVLKNKHGMKNLLDTYNRIREKSNSTIVIVLNQTISSDKQVIENQFTYFFGNNELNIDGVYKKVFNDENLIVTSLTDTNVYDLAEDYNLTSYEIAQEELDTAKFLKDEKDKGFESFKKALGFVNVYNKCVENYQDSFLGFYKDVKGVL